jgi:putative transposase
MGSRPPQRPGPMGPCTDPALVDHIRQVLAESPFHGEGYRKVWAKLRFKGIRTSKERVRRLMREHGLQAPQRVGHPHGPKAHDGTIITETPDEMWGTDATTTITLEEGQAYVFVGVDHCTFECTGIHASKKGDRFQALEPIRQGLDTSWGLDRLESTIITIVIQPPPPLGCDGGGCILPTRWSPSTAAWGVTPAWLTAT